jgi:glycosyltransferase involved in cell wall biosynthesis
MTPDLFNSYLVTSAVKNDAPNTEVTQTMTEEFCGRFDIPFDSRLKILMLAERSAVGFYRAYQPANFLNKLYGDKVIALSVDRTTPELIYGWADIVVASRQSHPEWVMFTRRSKAKFVYETDDLLHGIDAANPAIKDWLPSGYRFHWSLAIMEACHAIQTSTEPLLDYYNHIKGLCGKPQAVLPNAIDFSKMPPMRTREWPAVRIGWAGSGTHIRDLNTVGLELKKMAQHYGKKVEFSTLGFSGVYTSTIDERERDVLYGMRREDRRGVPIWMTRAYYAHLGCMNLDIAIMPLEDTEFNRCKSNLKMLEFGALGLPMVASRVKPYETFDKPHSGAYLALTAQGFRNRIESLIDSADDRKIMGEEARKFVQDNYSIEKIAQKYYEFYVSL